MHSDAGYDCSVVDGEIVFSDPSDADLCGGMDDFHFEPAFSVYHYTDSGMLECGAMMTETEISDAMADDLQRTDEVRTLKGWPDSAMRRYIDPDDPEREIWIGCDAPDYRALVLAAVQGMEMPGEDWEANLLHGAPEPLTREEALRIAHWLETEADAEWGRDSRHAAIAQNIRSAVANG
jgi:hypothetical protein